MCTREEAMELACCLRRFVIKGGIDQENAVKTVTLLRQLMIFFNLQLAMPNQMQPLKIKHVLAFIEARKAMLSERQLNYYEGIRLDYKRYHSIRDSHHSALIGMYAQLSGLRLE